VARRVLLEKGERENAINVNVTHSVSIGFGSPWTLLMAYSKSRVEKW
jgi:hypothetical protein